MGALLERLGVESPVVQAGMGGGLSRHELAASVSAAGGLGTVGFLPPAELRQEVEAARALTDGPLAVNLLLPFTRRHHVEAARDADVVVTFWGRPRRLTANVWMHQCGSVSEAVAARRAGADAVIAQGVESGGHVRGSAPATELLARVRRALGAGYPVLSAGGVAARDEARERIAAGAEAVVCGTRFLMTNQSGAHPEYRQRLIGSRETLLTELFGVGWPAPHRVVPNAATARWLSEAPLGPRAVRALNRLTSPLMARLPPRAQQRLATLQTARRPFFGPNAPTADGPASLVDAGPLYAGECVASITDVRDAGQLVRDLTP